MGARARVFSTPMGARIGVFSDAISARRRVRADADRVQVQRPRRSIEAALYGGDTVLDVVGEPQHQAHLWQLVGGRTTDRIRHTAHALLLAEVGNPSDPTAIGVWIGGQQVGHLPPHVSAAYRPGLLSLHAREGRPIALEATIVGGGMHAADRPGRLGVVLYHDPADFAAAPVRPRPAHRGAHRR